jgi:MFS family permease
MNKTKILNLTVLVAALGYFVDIYDLLLFPIVRQASLQSMGVPAHRLLEVGAMLLNVQMIGMLLGGVVWGVMGDKRGRLSVLFGSIALYSAANFANAFVTTVPLYGVCRFVAGFGLAGELGAAITLVAEILPKETRAYGTTLVAAVGVSGAVVAGLVGRFMTWEVAYMTGGGLGFALLLLRVGVAESGMFNQVKEGTVVRGSLWMLVNRPERFLRYLKCILIGLPMWYVVGILITFSPEFAQKLGVTGPIRAGSAVAFCYGGLIIGDFSSGFLSQMIHSRRAAVAIFIAVSLGMVLGYLNLHGQSPAVFYAMCMGLGFGIGYWAVFVTIASEQFGTNLRATVTITVPNFVRGALVPLAMLFQALRAPLGLIGAAMAVGVLSLGVAAFSLRGLEETHGKDLDFLED